MTSKERIIAAAERRNTDILAVGFKATDDVLRKLEIHFGVTEVKGVLDKLPVDTHGNFNNTLYGVYPEYVGGPEKVLYPNTYPDGSWDTIYGFKRHWVSFKGGRNDELLHPLPLEKCESIEEIAAHEWPEADWFSYDTIKAQCDAAEEYAVIFSIGGISTISNLIGHERRYTDMYLNPDTLKYTLGRISDFYQEFARRTFEAADGGIDIAVIHDDFGTQNGPQMSLGHFREFWKPFLRRFFSLAHEYGIKTMMHSCGAVFDFVPDFIDAGADILDPVQTTATGMEPEVLVKEYGKDICFHGGIDTQKTLATGTPEGIYRHIDHLVESFSSADGFILAPAHYIQGDVPLGNLLAMFDRIHSK